MLRQFRVLAWAHFLSRQTAAAVIPLCRSPAFVECCIVPRGCSASDLVIVSLHLCPFSRCVIGLSAPPLRWRSAYNRLKGSWRRAQCSCQWLAWFEYSVFLRRSRFVQQTAIGTRRGPAQAASNSNERSPVVAQDSSFLRELECTLIWRRLTAPLLQSLAYLYLNSSSQEERLFPGIRPAWPYLIGWALLWLN